MSKLTTLIENIGLCQERQDWRMCVPPQPDDTDIVLRDCEQTILELCTLLEKAEEAMITARDAARCTDSWAYEALDDPIAAIKQWKEQI